MRTLRDDGLDKVLAGCHLPGGDPPGRRLKTWQGRQRRSRAGPDRPILSRDRCPRSAVRRCERGQQVETSGYQPVPNEPGGFAAVPVPTAEAEAESPGTGWTYSFVAEPGAAETDELSAPVAPVLPAAPVADPLGGVLRWSRPTSRRPRRSSSRCRTTPRPSWRRRPRCPRRPPPTCRSRSSRRPSTLPPAPAAFAGDVVSVSDGTSVLVAESEAEESAYQRGSTEAEGDENDISLNDLLMHVLDTGASDLHLTSGARPVDPAQRRAEADGGPADPHPAGHPAGAVRRPHPEAAGEVRGEPRARLRLQRARPGPVPRQRLPPARRPRRGVPHHPVRDQEARGPRRAAVGGELRLAARVASSSSPARPAPASRRPWRR